MRPTSSPLWSTNTLRKIEGIFGTLHPVICLEAAKGAPAEVELVEEEGCLYKDWAW